MDATLELLSAPVGTNENSVPLHLQNTALLSLGGMARSLIQRNPPLANQITNFLAVALDHVAGRSTSSRLRRSADTAENTLFHVVLLDSIGNSKFPGFLPRLVDHVTNHQNSLAVKHASVKAIGQYKSQEVCKNCNSPRA